MKERVFTTADATLAAAKETLDAIHANTNVLLDIHRDLGRILEMMERAEAAYENAVKEAEE